MSAGQDHPITIAAGGVQRIKANGESYLFCKFADRDIRVNIGGREVVMRAGSYQEFEPLSGEQSNIVVYNDDPDNVAIVKFVTGTGTYDEKIIRGEITTVVGIKTGGGEYIADTRKKLALDVISVPGTGITENYGQAVETWFEGGASDWALINMDGTGKMAQPPESIDYNPAVHQLPIAMSQPTSGGVTFYAYEFDPITKQRGRYIGPVQDLGQQEAFTVFGDIHYQTNSFGTEGVYKRIGSSGSWELLTSLGNPKDMCVLDNGDLVVINGNSLVLINPAGDILATYATANSRQRVMTRNGQVWAFSSANYTPDVLDYNLEPIAGGAEGVLDSDGPCFGYGPYMVEMPSDDRLYVRPLETVTDLFAGKSYLACENAWLGPKPTNIEAVRTTADITVNNAESANPTVSGEVVKLILEWYLGKALALDYMDYVHAIEITGSTNINGAKFPPIRIQSNGQTFLAAKIPDDFRVIFPIQATLTIDQRAEQ
ncbi:hypothetical protein [Marinobacter salarius]|uniref:hypothetical protein n=1 Tax=Marinobacter salarius TaxID=1420917 RepID=UPI003D0C54CD